MNSKQQQSSIPKFQNYLSSQNNAALVSCTSEHSRGKAINILSSNPRQLWLTNDKLPQQIVFSIKRIHKRPSKFNMVGLYCWHQYDSNPALVQFWIKGDQTARWELIGKIRLARVSVWQYFKIQQFEPKNASQIKIKIVENFGGESTYLNKIGLFYNNQKSSLPAQLPLPNPQSLQASPEKYQIQQIMPSQPRPKTHSQHQSMASTPQVLQRQLKKACEQISYLVEQQEQMKKTILQQQKVIIKIQQTLKKVLVTMQKMQKIQDLQTKVETRVNSKQGKMDTNMKDKRGSQAKMQDSQNGRINRVSYNEMEDDQFQNQQETKHKKQRKNNRQNTNSNRTQIEQLKNLLNSFEKQSIAKLKPNYISAQNNQTQVIRTNSEQQLSQYSHKQSYYQSHNDYYNTQAKTGKSDKMKEKQKNKENKGDKAKMVERLVKLIQLRENKKKELKKSATKMGSWGKSRKHQYQGDQEDEDDQYYDNQ